MRSTCATKNTVLCSSVVVRYIQLNIQFSAAYRKYHEDIPSFMQNRPRDFIQHVRQRWTAAHDFTPEHVAAAGSRKFSVQSPDSGNVYTVDFGQAEHMPSCGCEDWHRFHWPCKHFCAVFQLTSYTWDELSSCYRDSPYFTIDSDVLKVLPGSQLSYTSVPSDDAAAVSADDQPSEATDVDDSQTVERCAVACRETLRQLVDATYLCVTPQPLQDMQRALTDTLSSIRQHLPADAGLALNIDRPPVPTVRRRTAAHQRFDAIPAAKRRRPATRSQQQRAAAAASAAATQHEDPSAGDDGLDQHHHHHHHQQQQQSSAEHDDNRYDCPAFLNCVLSI